MDATTAEITGAISTGIQTDLTARRLKNLGDGHHVTSLGFVRFITGKRVSELDRYGNCTETELSDFNKRMIVHVCTDSK